MEYRRRYRDLKYQETVFELLAKEFEIAKLDEAREGSIIQVVDSCSDSGQEIIAEPSVISFDDACWASSLPYSGSWFRERFHQASERPEHRAREL